MEGERGWKWRGMDMWGTYTLLAPQGALPNPDKCGSTEAAAQVGILPGKRQGSRRDELVHEAGPQRQGKGGKQEERRQSKSERTQLAQEKASVTLSVGRKLIFNVDNSPPMVWPRALLESHMSWETCAYPASGLWSARATIKVRS